MVDKPPPGASSCYVANENIAQAEKLSDPGPKGKADPWDGKSKPRYLDRIDAHLHLTPAEHKTLSDAGFVVLDRLPYSSYAAAFHDIFQEQLPLFVGVDPLLHAVHAATEMSLEATELKTLKKAFKQMIDAARRTLGASSGRYPRETLNDLDVYLSVARDLLTPQRDDDSGAGGAGAAKKLTLFGNDAEAKELLDRASGGGELGEVTLFGRARMIDFSQLTPRGHYASREGLPEVWLDDYFRSMMWLSRLEFNLVSRGSRSSQPGATPDPSETPREARAALALADLMERSGAIAQLKVIDDAYTAFAGRREDVPVSELLRLMKEHHFGPADADAPAKLKEAIGKNYARTARTHYMPEEARELPAIATLLGPRIVPDIAPLTRLVHDRLPDRYSLGGADVAYALGHDRARALLAGELEAFAGLSGALDGARKDLFEQARASRDIYGSFLRTVLAAASTPDGVLPSFMKREAYADMKINSALVGYAQLRHSFVLLAAQGYDAYGCEIPDAFVEPQGPMLDAMVEQIVRVNAVSGRHKRTEQVLRKLQSIGRHELAGAALSEPERRWLGMVTEHHPLNEGDTGEPPKWTGWYFDLFADREFGASRSPALIADYFTLTNKGQVAYLGVDGPRLAVFIVDTGGEPRAMVGPVAAGYEMKGPIADRLNDEAAFEARGKESPWRRSFAPPTPDEPEAQVAVQVESCSDPHGWRVGLRSEGNVGPVSVTLLDHHGDPLDQPRSAELDAGRPVVLSFPAMSGQREPAAIHVRVQRGPKGEPYDYFTSPSVYTGKDFRRSHERPSGLKKLSFGAPPGSVSAAKP